MDTLPLISDSYYAQTLISFKGSLVNDTLPTAISILKTKLPSLLPPPNHPVRILSVGVGTGEFDLQLLLEVILPHTSSIHYDAVDPNEEHIQSFSDRLQQDPVAGVHLHKAKLEDFHPKSGSYDLVLFVHCLYYLPRSTLANALSSFLPPNSGSIVLLMDGTTGHTSLTRSLGLVDHSNSQNLDGVLESIKHIDHHKEVVFMSQWMDLEDCFVDGSGLGLDLLSFAVFRDVRHAKRELLDEIRRHVQVHLVSKTFGDRRHWWLPEGITLIRKGLPQVHDHVLRS